MFTEFDTYLKGLATNHPDIAHTEDAPAYFHSITDLHNSYSGSKRKADGPYMAYAMGGYSLANDYDNPMTHERHEIWIVKKGNLDKPSELLQVFDDCERAAAKLLGRMLDDRENEVAAAQFFNLLSARIEQVGPVSSELYGVSVVLPRNKEFIPAYDPDEWLDA